MRESLMRRVLVFAIVPAAILAGCGGAQPQRQQTSDRPSESADRPEEGFQANSANAPSSNDPRSWKETGPASRSAGGKKPPGDTPRRARATFSVGSGKTVSLIGGGGAVDHTAGSNCTNNETNTTFTTRGDDESHEFGFDSRGGGSCSIEPSWSFFKVAVKDASGKEVGHGDTLWFGQTNAVGSYFVACDQGPGPGPGPDAKRPRTADPFTGLKCAENGDYEVKISLP